MITPPESLTYGKVVGRWIKSRPDTDEDLDRLPDAEPAYGNVTITPKDKTKRVVDDNGRYVGIIRTTKTYQLDDNGDLVSSDGNPGLWLISGDYTLKTSFNWPDIEFTVGPEHTAENPLDLLGV